MQPPRVRRSSLIAAAVACCFLPEAALANPVGPKVVHGNASFSQQGKSLTVTNSPGSIINWQGFSIAAGETTRFVQQNATSAVLNRVVGADASSILGALQSNGRVWLVNPNGILIGKGAQIDTAGLIASTLNVMNADFLLGRMRFVDTPGAKDISNAGEIRTPAGGRVVLISPQGVENSGIIQSPQGEVILAAGKTIEIADSTNPEVRIEVAAPEARAINLGKIVAQSGKVGIFGGIVVNRGVVSADSAVVGENGKIVFRASRDATLEAGSVTTASGTRGGSIEVQAEGTTLVSGTVQATGTAGAGGQVSVLGQQVGVIDQAAIDVSGSQGGGTVLVGGDQRGENPSVRNAQMTFFGSGASIKADALTEGNGGKVIVWADDTTRSHGSISARGGALGGDGGFVETSGKLNLSVTRGPDVRAPAGKSGTWLIDPNNITIVPGQVFDETTNTGAPFFAPLADGSQIGVDLINAQLDFGSNVLIDTTSRGTTAGTDAGNITLSAMIVKTAATVAGGPVIGTTSLSFQAHNDIIVNAGAGIVSTGDPLSVSLIANFYNSGAGALTLSGPITTRGGSVLLRARDLIQVNAPIHTLNAAGTSGGGVTVNSTAGTANLASTITGGSNVSVTGNAGANVTGPVTGNFFTGSSTTGPFVIASSVTATGMNINSFGFTAAPSAVINTGFGAFTVTDSSPSTVTIQAGASITSSGATVTSNGMQFDGTLNAGTGTVTLRQNTAGTPIFLGAEAAGGVALTGAELSRISTTGPMNIGNLNTGAITANGPVNFTGMSQLSITTGSSFTQNAGATITSSAPMILNAPNGITLNAASSAPRFTFIADKFAPNQPVTSGSDIDVITSSFVTIDLGVATQSGTLFDLTATQANNLITSAAGKLRIGTTSNDMLTIKGPIAPTGTSTLVLGSGNSIAQDPGATITVANLGLNVFGDVNLPEANVVGTIASNQCCAGNMFTFKNAAGVPLTIGTVDSISGISNFDSDATTHGYVDADNLTIAAPVQFFGGKFGIKPTTASTRVDLGGPDAAGVLGLSAAEIALVLADKFVICADIADITAAIASGATTFQVQPVTVGRILNIVAGTKNPANLEFVQSDINNVSANTLLLGGTNAGPVNVNAAVTAPATIGTFALQSADAATTGLTVNNPISATSSVSLIGDVMTLNAQTMSSAGSITVANSSAGRMIDLGARTAGKLALSAAEAQTQLSAPAGMLTFGSTTAGNLDVTSILNFTNAASVALISNGTATVGLSQGLAANGNLMISAPLITLNSTISSATGSISLTGDTMSIASTVSAPMGDITAQPLSFFRSIDVGTDDTGSTLGFTPTELNNFMPGATRVLRIGDFDNTGNITVRAAIAPANATTLSLVTSNGSVSQTAGSTIGISNLAVRADGNITLDQNNDTDTVAAQSNFGNINITYFGTNPLTVGTVDGVTGVSTTQGNIRLRSDLLNINNRVDSFAGFFVPGNVTITALSANQPLAIGTKGGSPGLLNSELDLIGATTLFLGDPSAANTGNVTVTAPVNITGGVQNLTITTSSSATTAVNNALTVPGTITINTGSLTTAAALTATGGAINATADAMTFGATATAGGQAITLKQRTNAPTPTLIAVGGADAASPLTLGLDNTDLGNLSYGAGTLTIGDTAAGDMSVTFAGTLPGKVVLATGGNLTVNSNFSAADTLSVQANTMAIPGAAGISAPNGISIKTATAGRNMILGTRGAAGNFELDTGDLSKISIGGPGTLSFDTTGSITTTAPLAFTMVPNISLSGGTINHTGGALSAPGAITLLANSMPAAGFSPVTSTGGGRVTIAPPTPRGVNVGTNPAGTALGILQTQLNQISTSGVVQIGDATNTGSVTFSAPTSQPAGSSALTVISNGAITQAAGAPITASNLRLQANGAVTLTAANTIGTLAGSSFGSFSLTSTGTTTIATVDGQSGINDGTITVLTDGINILSEVIGNTFTFAPRLAGTAINLGSGSGYVITDAAVDLIKGPTPSTVTTLNIGNSTTGSISVNSIVDRSLGNLVLTTAPGGSIMVNAQLGSSTTSSVTMNTGLGGTVNIGGAVLASSAITATGKSITVNAPVTSNTASVTLGAASGDTGSTLVVNQPVSAGTGFNDNVTFTADSQSINAALNAGDFVILQPRTNVPVTVGGSVAGTLSIPTSTLALINADDVTIGSAAAGDLTVVSPIGPFLFDSLGLTSGGNITQTAGSTITVKNTSSSGLVTGALAVNAGGQIVLTEPNSIAVSVTGNAGGTGNNFQFINMTPLKLQNVSGTFASGKVIIEIVSPSPPPPSPPPPPPPPPSGTVTSSGTTQEALDDLLNSVLRAADVQQQTDKDADARKADGEKKEKEQDQQEGRKSCG